MKFKVVVHNAEEGGYWAEVPAIPGCLTQGDTWEELLQNVHEAVEACLSVDVTPIQISPEDKVLEIAIWRAYLGKSCAKSWTRKGWLFKTVHGSHHVYMKAGGKERISVPVHGNKDLKLGMLRALMNIAEIDEPELQ
jgi:predicted RNase H-like HicB family nuclease/predicted RNA binding protein YcfA (HicA-like mRNA interferase family)